MIEQWKPIVGFEGRYEVSDQGRVRNVKTGYFKSTPANPKGYCLVGLTRARGDYVERKGKNLTLSLHRLVAEAFVPRVDGKDAVNHIDGVKSHNAAANLEWVTCSENTRHAIRTGLWDQKNRNAAVIAESLGGLEELRFESLRQAASTLGVDQPSISRCLSGSRKSCGGYVWRRA